MRMLRTTLFLAGAVLGAQLLTGCGGDRDERGLTPDREEAVPLSAKAAAETERERQADLAREIQTAEMDDDEREPEYKP
jgi:hypothetical protein